MGCRLRTDASKLLWQLYDDVHVTVIDFTKPENNDFLVVRELWVQFV